MRKKILSAGFDKLVFLVMLLFTVSASEGAITNENIDVIGSEGIAGCCQGKADGDYVCVADKNCGLRILECMESCPMTVPTATREPTPEPTNEPTEEPARVPEPTSTPHKIMPSPKKPVVIRGNVVKPGEGKPVTISVHLDRRQKVSIKIHDRNGRLIKTLVDRAASAGTFDTVWTGLNNKGKIVQAGIYIVHIKASDFEEKRKVVIIR